MNGGRDLGLGCCRGWWGSGAPAETPIPSTTTIRQNRQIQQQRPRQRELVATICVWLRSTVSHCLCICICVSMYLCIHVYPCIHVSVYPCICVSQCLSVCLLRATCASDVAMICIEVWHKKQTPQLRGRCQWAKMGKIRRTPVPKRGIPVLGLEVMRCPLLWHICKCRKDLCGRLTHSVLPSCLFVVTDRSHI